MEVIQYLKNIYDKENLGTHAILFSTFGIMMIFLNNIVNFLFGYNVLNNFFGYAPKFELEVAINFVVGTLLIIYSLGYVYNYGHKLLNDEISSSLPEPTFEAFSSFAYMLPVLLVWGCYGFILGAIGFMFFKLGTFNNYLYYSILLCFLPFVNIIFLIFSKDYLYKTKFFNPLFVFKIINRTLFRVLKLCIGVFFVNITFVFIALGVVYYAHYVENEVLKFCINLFGLCLGGYFLNILNYVYTQGLVKIIKEKF